MSNEMIEIAEFGTLTSQQVHFSYLLDKNQIEYTITQYDAYGEGAFALNVTKYYIHEKDIGKAKRLKIEADKIINHPTYIPFVKKGLIWLLVSLLAFVLVYLVLKK